eukprot:XP_008180453.1 PREDICTED: protein lingerer-like [Acyrthosiphon pisum]
MSKTNVLKISKANKRLEFEENSMGPGKKPNLRNRIPTPSKIPASSAVEMPPDDSSVNIKFLDVTFGSLDVSDDIPQFCDQPQEQNSLPPVVKYYDSIAQKGDSVLTQTEHSTISDQASVQTQRLLQVNKPPQPSIKMLQHPNVPHSTDYLTKKNSAVANLYQNINTGQSTSMYNSSAYSNNHHGLSSHTSVYGTTASNIGGNSSNSHNLQSSQSNYSNLNANYPQTEAQPQFPSYPYPNPYSYQPSGISYPPIVSDANLASMYFTSTYYNYMHQNIHQTGNTHLSMSPVLLTSTTNSTKESLTNFYSLNPMYPSVSSSLTGRETAGPGILNVASYSSVTDSRYAHTDNNASPDSYTLFQQTGTLAHQQILLNLPIAPSYAYYYGQMVVPASPFQYGTMYLMVPAASATSYDTVAINTMSGYSNTVATPAGNNNVNETLGSSSVTGSSNDHGSSSKPYDKQQQPFQSPPLFSVTNNDGVGGYCSAGSYPPVFNSSIPPGNPQLHHIAPLEDQQELSSEIDNISRNQSVNPTSNKVKVKKNYS